MIATSIDMALVDLVGLFPGAQEEGGVDSAAFQRHHVDGPVDQIDPRRIQGDAAQIVVANAAVQVTYVSTSELVANSFPLSRPRHLGQSGMALFNSINLELN